MRVVQIHNDEPITFVQRQYELLHRCIANIDKKGEGREDQVSEKREERVEGGARTLYQVKSMPL